MEMNVLYGMKEEHTDTEINHVLEPYLVRTLVISLEHLVQLQDGLMMEGHFWAMMLSIILVEYQTQQDCIREHLILV